MRSSIDLAPRSTSSEVPSPPPTYSATRRSDRWVWAFFRLLRAITRWCVFVVSSPWIRSSFRLARLYASTACSSCPSISWICASTLCASACFASIGSAEAVLTHAKATATKIAVRTVRSAGAVRLLELITGPSARTRQTPRGGQVRHKWGTLAGSSDSCNAQQSQKHACFHQCSRITNNDGTRRNLLRSATSWGRIQRGARRASWPS